jgi:uncharacterized SAM-binding protein YcdF (DUF218 family)
VKSFALGCSSWAIVALVFVVLAMKAPTAWLPPIGRALNVAVEPQPADVIIVLGGGDGDRAHYAGELFRKGLSTRVIATGGPVGSDASAVDLVRNGVPRGAIVLANGTQNTRDDALRSRELMEQNGWKTALLVTDPYHIRRSLWTFRTAFDGTADQILPTPVTDGWFDANHWWETENGFVAVNEEYAKLGYYVARGYVTPSGVIGR